MLVVCVCGVCVGWGGVGRARDEGGRNGCAVGRARDEGVMLSQWPGMLCADACCCCCCC